MKNVLIVISWLCFLVVGAVASTIVTYTTMVPIIEERIIKGVNGNLTDYGIKKFWFHLGDHGEVIMRVKTKGGFDKWKAQELRTEMAEKSRSLTLSTSSSKNGLTELTSLSSAETTTGSSTSTTPTNP